MIKNIFGLVLGCLVLFSACKEKETRDLVEIEDQAIQEFLQKNNLTSSFTKDSAGFYYQIIDEGEGDFLQNYNQVFFLLDLKKLDGTPIQSTASLINSNVSFMPNLNSVDRAFLGYLRPQGLRNVILKTKYGGKIRALIPSYLMYGKTGYNTIVPGNTVLDATIDVLSGKTQTAAEDSLLNRFIKLQPETYTKDESGVYYHVVNEGTGDSVTVASTIKAVYTGKFLNGEVFDSSTAESPLETTLGSYEISGWRYVLPKIKTGGKIKIFVPSYLGYSSSGSGRVLPNTPLYFEIELLQ